MKPVVRRFCRTSSVILRESGFTLIELMIVVGIIGLLASVAGPVYERYQSRSRQAEAKLGLAAIFTAEKGFYAEYAAYISSFDAMNWAPEASRRFYSVGWSTLMMGTVTGYSGVYTNPVWNQVNTPPQFGCSAPGSYSSLPAPVGSDSQTFAVNAAGEVRIGTGCDVWTVNDQKAILNTTVGI